MTRSGIRKALCLIVFVFVPALMFAAGQGEDPIRKAQQLIDEKQDEKALVFLAEIWRTQPERSAEAQEYINFIMKRKQRTNELKEKILTEISEGYDEHVLAYMEELKKLDPNVTGWIEQTRILWTIIKRNREFNAAMDAAYQLLLQGKFRESIDAYKKGFTIQRDEFYNNPAYGNIVRTNVQGLFRRFDALVTEYYSKADVIAGQAATLQSLVSDNRYRESAAKAEELSTELSALLDLRRRVISLGKRFIEQNDNIKKTSPDRKGDNFLFYSYQVILGRNDQDHREGVFSVVETNWSLFLDKASAQLKAAGDKFYIRAREDYANGNLEAANASFTNAREFQTLITAFLSQYGRTVSATAPVKADSHDRSMLREKLPLYFFSVERGLESRVYLTLIGIKKAYERVKDDTPSDEAAFQKVRSDIRETVRTLDEQALFWRNRSAYLDNLKKNGAAPPDINQAVPDIQRELNTLLASYRKLDLEFGIAVAERELKELQSWPPTAEERFAEAKKLREGEKPDEGQGVVRKYPSQALERYNTLLKDSQEQNVRVKAYREKWTRDADYISGNNEIRRFVDSARELERSIGTLQEKIAAVKKLADEQIRNAASFRNQGYFEYNRAKETYARKDFPQTKENLDRSITAFTTSLSYEENPQVRALLEGELKTFVERTYQAGLEQRLAELRTNIEQGKDLYNLTNFEGAEKKFNYAKKLQEELVGEPDSEIDYWIQLVQRALRMQPQREISIKDPPYPEMTKRFNLATESYRAGLAAKQKGDNEAANKYFQAALEIIKQIKIEYPYHRESGVLYLKIRKAQIGDAQFRREFPTMVRDALNEPNLQKASADLKDLEEIDPNFPGLKAAIAQVDAKLYQKHEITTQDIAESNRLLTQAQLLYNTRVRDNYKEALLLLNRGLVLNPNNIPSRTLKGRILRELNIGTGYAISPVDQNTLLEAENLVNRGDCLRARTLLDQLKRNPVNRNNPRVQDLELKIEACR